MKEPVNENHRQNLISTKVPPFSGRFIYNICILLTPVLAAVKDNDGQLSQIPFSTAGTGLYKIVFNSFR